MGTGRHYSTDWQYTNQFVFLRCSQPEINPGIKLFGLSGNRFSKLTDFAFEFVDFIAKLLEQFMHLRISMRRPMFDMLMPFEAFAEVLFVFLSFLMNSMSQIVHARLFEVLGSHVHVLNPMTMFVHLPFNVSMFCFRMGPVPLVFRMMFSRMAVPRMRGMFGTPIPFSLIGLCQGENSLRRICCFAFDAGAHCSDRFL